MRFVRVPGAKELNPILKPIFGEDEHDAVELRFLNSLSLRLSPKNCPQRFSIGTVIVTVRPHHQRSVTTSGDAILQLCRHPLDQRLPSATRKETNRVAATPRP
jgi:hypothetical protein